MANLQKYFEEFNHKIRLGRFEELQTLREKRDIIQRKLKDNLPDIFKKYNEPNLIPNFRDQGSYEMGTGIKPLDSDFDIDQGVYFDTSTSDYPDPVVLKERIQEALKGHTKRVNIRRPCVTVFYQKDGEPIYHVDLAIYSVKAKNPDGKDYLAMGKLNSQKELRVWQESDPQGLTDTLFGRFKNDTNGRHQFRRSIRYMKRWKDINFSSEGNHAPRGIALTISAHHGFQPNYSDTFAQKMDDLTALLRLVESMLNGFRPVWRESEKRFVNRIVAYLPVAPNTDIYARMSDGQMSAFEDKLKTLKDALAYAKEEVDPTEACKRLRKLLGEDFPVPPKQETAKNTLPPVVSSGNAA